MLKIIKTSDELRKELKWMLDGQHILTLEETTGIHRSRLYDYAKGKRLPSIENFLKVLSMTGTAMMITDNAEYFKGRYTI